MKGSSGFRIALLVAAMIIACPGCGGGDSPTLPDVLNGAGELQVSGPERMSPVSPGESRVLLGVYRVVISDTGEVAVVPMRQGEIHIDVTNALFPPNCYDCFRIEVLGIEDYRWDFRFTLKNPTGFTGYDVRATLLDMGNVTLATTPDSYTECFASGDDPTPRNPFFIFNSGQARNEWGPMASGSRDVSIERPPGAYFTEIVFVIDASWPDNQEEPLEISNMEFSTSAVLSDGIDTIDLSLEARTWEGEVSTVTADMTPLGWGPEVYLEIDPVGVWHLDGITCAEGIEPGRKDIWFTATNQGDSTYNYTTINVEEPPVYDAAEWTLMLYLNAVNLPDEEDINELEMSGSIDDELNLIVLWDKPEEWEQDVIIKVLHDPTGYNLNMVSVEIDDGGAVIPPGGLNMADPATLEAFMLWTMENYPARHYILDLWDHGSGIFIEPEPRVPFRNVCGGLSLWDIRDACATALDAQNIVDKIDIVGFDVCLLGWMETAYCLRDVADIVVASQLSEPGPGWDYGPPFINLRDNIGTHTAEELAYDIVKYYVISYSDPWHPYHYPMDHCTLSACSVAETMETAVPALNDFATACMQYLPEYKEFFADCLDATWYWGWDMTDIGHFAHEVSSHSQIPEDARQAASDLVDAVEASMINHGHTYGVPAEESGWNIWFPWNIAEQPPQWLDEYCEPGYLEFSDTLWDEFLWAFSGEIPVIEGWLEIEQVDLYDDAGGNGNGIPEPGETIDIFVTIRNTGDETATNVHGLLHENPGYDAVYEIVQAEVTYIDLLPDWTTVNAIPYQVHILPGVEPGQSALMRLDLICDQASSTNLPISFVIDPGDILVLDLDSNGSTAPAIEDAIEANGYQADLMTMDMDEAPYGDYQAVFITLGMCDWWNGEYWPDQDDYDAVEEYLSSGGKLYIESGDLWYYFPWFGYPDFSPLFGITALEDGWDEITTVSGESGGILDGLEFDYPGDDSFPDHIDAALGADLVMSAESEELITFGVGVTYNSGTYRTIGLSIEFGGIADGVYPSTKAELMGRFLSFLGM